MAGLTKAPSQLLAILAISREGGVAREEIVGHAALDDRGDQIELGFDRSFLEGHGLHRLSIDFRLYTAAISLVVGGRSRQIVPMYATIYTSNERSRRNYRDLGALEQVALPRCMRLDKQPEDLVVPGLTFSVFSPEAILAGFDRMLERLQIGRTQVGPRTVPLSIRGSEVAAPIVAERLREDVERLCRRHSSYRLRVLRAASA